MTIRGSGKGNVDSEWLNDKDSKTKSLTIKTIIDEYVPILSNNKCKAESVDKGIEAFNHHICHCTHDGSNRFGKDNMIECASIIIDVDFGGLGHNKSQYGTAEEALKAIEGNLPQCAMLLHTGGGYQIIYKFKLRMRIKDNVELIEKVWKALSGLVSADTCCSIGHPFRMPCSINNKIRLNPRPVKILYYNPDCSHAFDELKAFVLSKGIDLESDNLKIASPAKPKKRKTKDDEKPDLDRSYHAYKYIIYLLAKGEKDENRIVQKIRSNEAFSAHYPDDNCIRRDIRVAMQELANLIPKPKNSVETIDSTKLSLSDGIAKMAKAFESCGPYGYALNENIYKTLKLLEHITSMKESGIIAVPCGVGKSTSAIILAAEKAKPDYRILFVTRKVDDVIKTAGQLKYLGANAIEWHGFNSDKCKRGIIYEKAANKRFNPCQFCKDKCSCANKMLSTNRYDSPGHYIIVTTHAHYKTLWTLNKLDAFHLVIIDENPMEFEYFSLDSEAINSILYNIKDEQAIFQTVNDFISDLQKELGTGNCKNISHLNLHQHKEPIKKHLRALYENDRIDDLEFEFCIDFVNFICDNTTYYGFMHYERSQRKDKRLFSMIKGEVEIETNAPHIILDGSAKLSDVCWKGFNIYELKDIKLFYPNTFLCALNYLPSKSKLNSPEVIGKMKKSISKIFSKINDPIILLMSNKKKSIKLEKNINEIEQFIKEFSSKIDHLYRGSHIGSNKGIKANINIIAMSIFNTVEYYVLRAALASGKEISADKIWNQNEMFQSPKFKNNGGFAEPLINNAYIRSVTHHLYQAIMRGKIRSSSDAKYCCLFMISSVEVIALLKSYLPESSVEFEGSMVIQLLEDGYGLQDIAKMVKIKNSKVRNLRDRFCYR